MHALLYFNTTSKTVTDGTGTWTPPEQTFGETLSVAIRFQETNGSTTTESFPTVMYAKAGPGVVDARPAAGKWRLVVGDGPRSDANTTAPLDFNAGAQALEAAINALGTVVAQYGQAKVQLVDGSFLIRFASGALVALALAESTLTPPCYELTRAWQENGEWVHEFRLVQAPAVFTDTSARVLPPAPSVARVQEGGSDGAFSWNEIQQVTLPPTFRGSYQFRRNNVRTALLSLDDGPTETAAALAVYGSTIEVTNPRSTVCRLEYTENFAGQPQPLLEVIVVDAPPGDLTLTLPLTSAALAAMLRAVSKVTLPLEVEIGIQDDQAPGGTRVEKFTLSLTVNRGVIWEALATAANINWLRPVARDYVPFTADQVITGQQFYACALGDGEATEFVVDHNLATDAIAGVFLSENSGEGRVLEMGKDYSVVKGGLNSLTIKLLGEFPLGGPASGAYSLVITGAGPVAAFQAHSHMIAQIVGLPDVLEDHEQRLGKLEAYLPAAVVASTPNGKTLTISIPNREEVLFYNPATLDLTKLPVRAPALLPALSSGSATDLPSPLPTPQAGMVWQASANGLLIPGSGGAIPARWVPKNGYVGSDGRMLYPVNKDGENSTYYPAAFERELFEFPINEVQFLPGRRLLLEFSVTTQLLKANCEAQWVLVLEHGVAADQTTPATQGQNLEGITWNPTPLLRQRLYLTSLGMTHGFGCQIINDSTGIKANQIRYGGVSVADSAPGTANFVLRARLINFDIKNNVHQPTGWLYYSIGGSEGSEGPAEATIS